MRNRLILLTAVLLLGAACGGGDRAALDRAAARATESATNLEQQATRQALDLQYQAEATRAAREEYRWQVTQKFRQSLDDVLLAMLRIVLVAAAGAIVAIAVFFIAKFGYLALVANNRFLQRRALIKIIKRDSVTALLPAILTDTGLVDPETGSHLMLDRAQLPQPQQVKALAQTRGIHVAAQAAVELGKATGDANAGIPIHATAAKLPLPSTEALPSGPVIQPTEDEIIDL